jgi:hypothetical protein
MSALRQHGVASCHAVDRNPVCDDTRELQLIKRQIQLEFDYLPGLKLTFAQARRLFGLDSDCCARVLASLLEEGMLTLTADGAYVRAICNRTKSA